MKTIPKSRLAILLLLTSAAGARAPVPEAAEPASAAPARPASEAELATECRDADPELVLAAPDGELTVLPEPVAANPCIDQCRDDYNACLDDCDAAPFPGCYDYCRFEVLYPCYESCF